MENETGGDSGAVRLACLSVCMRGRETCVIHQLSQVDDDQRLHFSL